MLPNPDNSCAYDNDLAAGCGHKVHVVEFFAKHHICCLECGERRKVQIPHRRLRVEHIRISSGGSFVEVRRKLEGTVPKLDSGIAEALLASPAAKPPLRRREA